MVHLLLSSRLRRAGINIIKKVVGSVKVKSLVNAYGGLHKSIYILFIVNMIASAGNLVFPFLAIYMADKLHFNNATVGFYMMMVWLIGIPSVLLGGKLSDSVGRRHVIIISHSITAVLRLSCAFAGDPLIIVWMIIASCFFGSLSQASYQAMVADLTLPSERKKAFSLQYLGGNIGFALGPLIAGFLYNNHVALIFIGNAFALILTVFLIMIYIEESKPEGSKITAFGNSGESVGERAETGGLISVLLKRPNILLFILIYPIFIFVYSQHTFIIPLQLNESFGAGGPAMFGSLMTVNAVVVVTMTTFIISFTQKNKAISNIALSGVFYAIGFGMLYFVNHYALLILSTVIWTIGEILSATEVGVYLAEHTPESHRGRMNSILPIIFRAGSSLGTLIMGRYIAVYSIRSSWIVVLVVSIIAAAAMYGLFHFEKRGAGKNMKAYKKEICVAK